MNDSTKSYFDLHITGIGYVNRIREVQPKRGDAFWACDISALLGPGDDVEYRRFDCRVSGSVAASLVKKFQSTVEDRKEKGLPEPKFLIGFKLGDLWTDTFTYSKGDLQGKMGVSLKARLLFIAWVKVDGQKVYEAPRREDPLPEQSAEAAPRRAVDSGSVGAGEATIA